MELAQSFGADYTIRHLDYKTRVAGVFNDWTTQYEETLVEDFGASFEQFPRGNTEFVSPLRKASSPVTAASPTQLDVRLTASNNGPRDVFFEESKPVELDTSADAYRRQLRLMAALMDHNWLGLKVLAVVFSAERATLEVIAQECEASPNLIAVALARLALVGAVATSGDDHFQCTAEGASVAQNLLRDNL